MCTVMHCLFTFTSWPSPATSFTSFESTPSIVKQSQLCDSILTTHTIVYLFIFLFGFKVINVDGNLCLW